MDGKGERRQSKGSAEILEGKIIRQEESTRRVVRVQLSEGRSNPSSDEDEECLFMVCIYALKTIANKNSA